jgi:hypothetical protein
MVQVSCILKKIRMFYCRFQEQAGQSMAQIINADAQSPALAELQGGLRYPAQSALEANTTSTVG